MYIQITTSLLTATVNDNVLAGNQFEFSPARSVVEVGLVASATGLEVDILVGARAVVTRMLPSIQNRFPIYPDDFTVRFGAMQGERIIIRVRNPTGGTLTINTTVKFNPR